jgi:hypothetical protein
MATLVQANSNTTATTFTAATEVAAIVIGDPINTLDAEGQGVLVQGNVVFTAGATPGTVTVKVRQGSGLAGATVASWIAGTTIAATNLSVPIHIVDTAPLVVPPGNAGSPVYTITLTVAGSNGTGVLASGSATQYTGQN